MDTSFNPVAPLTLIDLNKLSGGDVDSYKNMPVTIVNDHVVRLSIMKEAYFWHLHPDSDETFLVIEGSVIIELENSRVELFPNQIFTIPKNTRHRTSPGGARSVNLTFEHKDMHTVITN